MKPTKLFFAFLLCALCNLQLWATGITIGSDRVIGEGANITLTAIIELPGLRDEVFPIKWYKRTFSEANYPATPFAQGAEINTIIQTLVCAQKQDSVYLKKFSDDGETVIKELVKPDWCGDKYAPCPYQIKLQTAIGEELIWDATDTLSEKLDAILDFKYDKSTNSISALYAKKEDLGLGMRLGVWSKNNLGKWTFKYGMFIAVGKNNLYFEGISLLYFDTVFVKYNSYYNDDKISNSMLISYSPPSKIYRLLSDGTTMVYDIVVNEQYRKNTPTVSPKHETLFAYFYFG